MLTDPPTGLPALRIVLERLPSEEDGTASIIEVAQRRLTALSYLKLVERDYKQAVELLNEFDGYAGTDGSPYHGSPFQAKVREFLEQNGVQL